MRTLQFSRTAIPPSQDITELDVHHCIDIANDFEHAIAEATTTARCCQLRERLGACIGFLMDVQNVAAKKADQL